MTTVPTVSAVIPTHRRTVLLREAIDSVLHQTRPATEVVVVSDTDDEPTRALVAELGRTARIPVRFVRNDSAPGASGSRNLGAAESTGELLAFLDDDDLWLPDHLEALTATLMRRDVELAVAWLEPFDEAGDVSEPIRLRPDLDARRAAYRGAGLTGSNLIVRRAAFDRIGGFDPALRNANDRDFFYRFLRSGGTYAVREAVGVRFRQHGSGRLTDQSPARDAAEEAFLHKHRSTLPRGAVRRARFHLAVVRYRRAGTRGERLRQLGIAAANLTWDRVRRRLRKLLRRDADGRRDDRS